MVDWKNIFKREIPIFLIFALTFGFAVKLSYEQGYFEGMDYLCSEDLVVTEEGIVFCDELIMENYNDQISHVEVFFNET